jgi:hypothetical protein
MREEEDQKPKKKEENKYKEKEKQKKARNGEKSKKIGGRKQKEALEKFESKTVGSIIELGLEMLPTSTELKKNRKKNNWTREAHKKGKGGQTKKGRTNKFTNLRQNCSTNIHSQVTYCCGCSVVDGTQRLLNLKLNKMSIEFLYIVTCATNFRDLSPSFCQFQSNITIIR